MTKELAPKSLGRHRTVDGYSVTTGKLTHRDRTAQERLELLAEQLRAGGMSKEEAFMIAREEMRDNPRKDWRAG
jgi:uncharacterized protein YoaH (UPF0181 family)